MLSKEYLETLVGYDELTGVLTWKIDRSNGRMKCKGKQTGSYHKVTGYRYVSIDNKRYLEHRLIWLLKTGSFPKNQIDHINGIRSDNSWVNLRDVDNATNTQNQKKPKKNNTTGFMGIVRNGKGFSARILANGIGKYLGTFKTAEEAHEVYMKAKIQLHQGYIA
jgi:hypothetical protein